MASSPEQLAELGIIMYPYSLPKDWGDDAPERYWKALGFTKLPPSPDTEPAKRLVLDPSL